MDYGARKQIKSVIRWSSSVGRYVDRKRLAKTWSTKPELIRQLEREVFNAWGLGHKLVGPYWEDEIA